MWLICLSVCVCFVVRKAAWALLWQRRRDHPHRFLHVDLMTRLPPTASVPPVCVSPSTSTVPTFSAAQSVPWLSTSWPHRSRSPRERGGRSDTRRSHRPVQSSDLEDRLLDILQEPMPKPSTDIDDATTLQWAWIPTTTQTGPGEKATGQNRNFKPPPQHREQPDFDTAITTPKLHSVATPPTSHTHFAPRQRPGTFTRPPPVNPIGPFTQMMASRITCSGGECSNTPYTDLSHVCWFVNSCFLVILYLYFFYLFLFFKFIPV